MSTTYKTSLRLIGAPLPPTFNGTPQQLFEQMLARTKIVAPFGLATIWTGDSAPTSDQGPWLKDGTKWWVWSAADAAYIPLDLSDSLEAAYWAQFTTPSSAAPPLWFKFDAATGTRVVDILYYFGPAAYDNTMWVSAIQRSGTTANRPTNPATLEQYWDTSIACLIHWERDAWRTVSGTPGDVKFTTHSKASDATTDNPGWEVLGTGDSNNAAWRGCVIGQATRDSSGLETDLSMTSPATSHSARTVIGTEEHQLTAEETPVRQHRHNVGVEISGTTDFAEAGEIRSNGGFQTVWVDSDPPDSEVGRTRESASSLETDNDPHNIIQPTLYLWTLRKK